jgi:Rrf2 family nitric oxide-sensitive transcriptional repressor
MRLTLHFDYALRTLIFLAAHRERRVTTQQVSDAYGISKNHLVRVIQNLERHGYVTLTHGRSGGVALAREPQDIRFGEVLRAIEPNMNLVECFDRETNTCPITPVCKLKAVLRDAGESFAATLDKYTLADIVGPNSIKNLREHFLAPGKP